MDIKKIEEFEDREGRKRKIIFRNKIEEISLIEPSEWYVENVLKPLQKQNAKVAKQIEKEEKIQQKLREMAVEALQKYQCSVCSYVYDPEIGDPEQRIEPGTSFKDLPKDWVCPKCGADKKQFNKLK